MTYDAGGVERLDALLTRATHALRDVGTVGNSTDPPSAEGAAADNLVRVRVSPNRIEALTIDGRAMRLGSAELAARISQALNDAFSALSRTERQTSDLAREARAASQALAERVSAIQDESARSMTMFVHAMQQLTDRIEQNGRRS
ncbi:hypothetical protein [Actinoplanes siamensis]|uniref:YbaB/EbfC DNA-binding family protein n=1 Tax=Actinoplanes siamensis TaxID=1223317 RepID=A0A919TM13_9ACTN|nr:hypothetical protein [Actinoplanes siamensis]GIF07836.1 hypothetical protein Asi03nite_53740 [Actinoplanes siamensis]